MTTLTTESFWSRLNLDRVDRRTFARHYYERPGIFDYIECCYNRRRTPGALGRFFPADFELKHNKPGDPTSPSVVPIQPNHLCSGVRRI